MRYTVPDYYRKFQCLASECPATCCAGWQIVIDERTQKKYKNYPGGFGSRLMNSIDWENESFCQYEGRCAFLNEENLCDIHIEAGPEMMCRTCRTYPKHIEEYDNEREISLSVSCPAVARMLLSKKEKTKFISAERSGRENQDAEFDDLLYSVLQDCRKKVLEFAQNREDNLALRMAKILALVHDVQGRIDGRRIFETSAVLERYSRQGADEALARKLYYVAAQCPQEEFITRQWRILDYLREFEVLDASWSEDLQEWRKVLYQDGERTYQERKLAFRKELEEWETEQEQILVYFLFTYFNGAVYDGDALSKAKMSVVSILILQELMFAYRIQKQESLTLEDRARIVWRYSRELEHSDLNLNAMEQMMQEWEEAEFGTLLKLIL